jgi:hypothetical protein
VPYGNLLSAHIDSSGLLAAAAATTGAVPLLFDPRAGEKIDGAGFFFCSFMSRLIDFENCFHKIAGAQHPCQQKK